MIWLTLKRNCRYLNEIFIIGCTGSCLNDNFWYSHWLIQNRFIYIYIQWPGPGATLLKKNISVFIKFHQKFHFPIIWTLFNWSLHYFAHGTIALLSWRVKNYVVIPWPGTLNANHDGKNREWNGLVLTMPYPTGTRRNNVTMTSKRLEDVLAS